MSQFTQGGYPPQQQGGYPPQQQQGQQGRQQGGQQGGRGGYPPQQTGGRGGGAPPRGRGGLRGRGRGRGRGGSSTNPLVSQSTMSSLHTYSKAETRSFSEHINDVLANDTDLSGGNPLPINPESDDLFKAVTSGVLLCKLLNAIKPGLIDEKQISKKPRNKFEALINHRVVINACRQLGLKITNIGPEDLYAGDKPHLVLGVVWQIIRFGLMQQVNVAQHPELGALIEKGESVDHFAKLPAEINLLRWFNYHLAEANYPKRVYNFGKDIADSKAYTVLLSQLAPGTCDKNALNMPDPHQAAETMLQNAAKLGCRKFVTPEDVVLGNEKLNLAFVATLFNAHPGITLSQSESAQKKQAEIEAAVRDKLAREEDEFRRRLDQERAAFQAELEEEKKRMLAELDAHQSMRQQQWDAEEQAKRKFLEEQAAKLEQDRQNMEQERERLRKEREAHDQQRAAFEQQQSSFSAPQQSSFSSQQPYSNAPTMEIGGGGGDQSSLGWSVDPNAANAANDPRVYDPTQASFVQPQTGYVDPNASYYQQPQASMYAAQPSMYGGAQQSMYDPYAAATGAGSYYPPQQPQPSMYGAGGYGQSTMYTATTTTMQTSMGGFQFPIPTLRLTLEEGRSLAKKDMMGLGKSDPYCIVQIRDQRYVTRKCKGTQYPVWYEELTFSNISPNDELVVAVWDSDRFKKDDFMGEVRILAKDFRMGSNWYRLKPRRGASDKVKGDLKLKFG
mmetsp:Transcript_7789/g.11779  ORF Transcript_7789/g.11779 Transcript_7789/m.11779 type:complete len:730 (+) Transcript_7789:287-2476(+)